MSDSKKEKQPEPKTLAEVGEQMNWGGDHFSSKPSSSPSQREQGVDKYFAGTVPEQQPSAKDFEMLADLARQTYGDGEADD